MAKKKFTVREGYCFQSENKDYAAGEIVELDEEVGSAAHQLEPVGKTKKDAVPVVDQPVTVDGAPQA